jgi:glycosyltransferase involved in cell wall biosynthesis
MSKPLITIGITCYAEGEWLKECWESVLAQTDDRWQAVLVMDGAASPDTDAVFNELEHPKLKKFKFDENQGPYVCRNKAFELTETPYHFYLDADDRLLPQAIEAVLQVFEFEPDVAYVSLNWRNLETKELYKVFREQGISELIAGSNYSGPGAYSVGAWKRLGGFCIDPILSRGLSDFDFHLALEEYDFPRAHSGRPLYLYRVGNIQSFSKIISCATSCWRAGISTPPSILPKPETGKRQNAWLDYPSNTILNSAPEPVG